MKGLLSTKMIINRLIVNLANRIIPNEKGVVVVLVVLSMIVMLGFLGLTLDVGCGYAQKLKLQNALDAAVLAGVQALPSDTTKARNDTIAYAGKNGINLDAGDITISYDCTEITCSKTLSVPLFFGAAFGLNQCQVSGSATAAVVSSGSPVFDYVIFSSDPSGELDISGAHDTFDGKVHVNGNTDVSGSHKNFNYDFECAGSMSVRGSNNRWQTIIMQDTDLLDWGGSNSYQTLTSPTSIMPIPEYDIDELRSRATESYSGSKHFSGSCIEVNGIIFVDGDVHISGSGVRGQGSIVATGDIQISGAGFRYQTEDSLVALYSLGDIQISGSNQEFDGVLYAPNGTIDISGSNSTYYGSLVAQNFDITGSDHHFSHDSRSSEALGERRTRLRG